MERIRKLIKNKKWKDACFLLESVYESRADKSVEIYILYGTSLRNNGEINKSLKVLTEGHSLYIENEEIVKELISSYQTMNRLSDALSLAVKLVEYNPSSNNSFLLGEIYASLNERKKAKSNFIKGLELKHDLDIEQLIQKISDGIKQKYNLDSQKDLNSTTEYKFIDGRSNYGAFIHYYDNKQFFTKIAQHDKLAMREDEFYKQVSQEFSNLNNIIPNYVHSFVLDGILYLTIEFLESNETNLDHLISVIETSRKISSIEHSEVQKKFPNLKYSFKLKNKPNPAAIFFTKIHKQKYNEKLFQDLELLMEENEYPIEIIQKVKEVKDIIMNNKLYTFVKPNLHYSLIHGDLNKKNIRVDKLSQEIKVIDWETYKIGLKTIDIARFFSANRFSYKKVQEIYLNDDKINGYLTDIEKIFFLYILMIFYILTIREKKIINYITEFIEPLIKDMENLVDIFKNKTFQNLLETNEKNKRTAKKYLQEKEELKDEKERFRQENIELKEQLKYFLNSDSQNSKTLFKKLIDKFKK